MYDLSTLNVATAGIAVLIILIFIYTMKRKKKPATGNEPCQEDIDWWRNL